jgi:hypothetical protein
LRWRAEGLTLRGSGASHGSSPPENRARTPRSQKNCSIARPAAQWGHATARGPAPEELPGRGLFDRVGQPEPAGCPASDRKRRHRLTNSGCTGRSTGAWKWPLWHRPCHQDCAGNGSFLTVRLHRHHPARYMKGPCAGGTSDTVAFIAEQRAGRAGLAGTRLVSVRLGARVRCCSGSGVPDALGITRSARSQVRCRRLRSRIPLSGGPDRGRARQNRRSSRSITTSLFDASSSAMACSRAAASSRESVVFSFDSINST